MKRVFALFWHKFWDDIGHVVLINFIWFTLSIPFFLAVLFAVRNFVGERPSLDTGASVSSSEAAGEVAAPSIESSSSELASSQSEIGSTGEAVTVPQRHNEFRMGADAPAAIIFLIFSWTLMCAATGFVSYGMADLTTEHDFSGYRFLFRSYLRRGPVLRSVALLTLLTVTFCASWANIIFYVILAQSKGIVFLLLAGIMLWFVLFATMSCILALPIMAQRDLKALYARQAEDRLGTGQEQSTFESLRLESPGLWPALKTAGIISLGSPVRTLVVTFVGFVIFLIGIPSAGIGFFAVSAPQVLFNADIYEHFGGLDRTEEKEGN
jgi:hypothetical protein